ncbi:ABC transporter permease [Eubacteriales bacterium OttesenSCG-928-A19]|nr:ABC transporter permease [Eubacteriales bacterium OttesenSCG-928-A19]
MIRYILKRLGQSLLVLFIVTVMVFLVMHMIPGDPIQIVLGDSATPEQIEFYTKEFGLDQPLHIQYIRWIAGLFRGEMGRSVSFSTDVKQLLGPRIVASLTVALPAFFLAVIVGVTLGILAATHRGKWLDSAISVVANIGIATPSFWIGILLVFIFAIGLGWLPVQGYTPLAENAGQSIRQLIIPVIVLALGPTASFARQTRSAMLEVISQDYIRTARSKGLKEKTITIRHALHNALIPIVTLMGMSLGHVVGGSVIVERLFVIPGMGTLLMTAITSKDYMVVQNVVLIIAAFVLACNLLVDILYGYIDPRIRVE